jgi:hypothetical protein
VWVIKQIPISDKAAGQAYRTPAVEQAPAARERVAEADEAQAVQPLLEAGEAARP